MPKTTVFRIQYSQFGGDVRLAEAYRDVQPLMGVEEAQNTAKKLEATLIHPNRQGYSPLLGPLAGP